MNKSLLKILQSQGFGSRKECKWLIKESGVKIADELCHDPEQKFELEGLRFEVATNEWNYREKVYIILNKPEGYECSNAPQHHPSVLELLPDQFVQRGVRIAGRLDVDTSGLLLLSDDGQFIHQATSPKKEVRKVYQVGLKHPFSDEQQQKLEQGVELNSETGKFTASDIVVVDDNQIQMTIYQGSYHQVKRMIGAVSNRVEKLMRIGIGDFTIDTVPEDGKWRYLEADELGNIGYTAI